MERLNILIIDRSSVFCKKLRGFLSENEAVQNVETTTDLTEGIRILSDTHIDIVILDVMYPDQDGQQALKVILNHKVLPVIVVAEPSVNQTTKTVTAMSNGAIDFIKKVNHHDKQKLSKFESELLFKMQNVKKANRLRSIARKVKANPLKETPDVKQLPVEIADHHDVLQHHQETIVVIGTSTGGPRALHQVIQQIPKDFDEAILIVQHMPAGFTKSLAQRLHNIGNITVKEAVHDEEIKKGTAYIAPGDYHMEAVESKNGIKIKLSQGNEHLAHRPSVDLLFESVAVLENRHTVAAVLTGMGRDGTKGVIEIKNHEKEAVILAESKETAVIDGMPRAAFETELVTQVLPIEKIGTAIVKYTSKRGK